MLNDLQRFPITAILCIGAVASFAAELSGRSVEHMVLSAPLVMEEPWRLVTTIFPHGGVIHLLFNLLWIWMLGRMIEARIGTGGMLVLVLVTTLSASGMQLVFVGRPIGLSGVVYGLAGYAWMRGRRDPIFRGVIDDSTRNLLVAWFFVCILLTWIGAMNIANAAHAGGALMGIALGTGRPWIAPLILSVLGTAVLFRASIPIRDPAAYEWFVEGGEAFNARDLPRAERFLDQATRRDPEMAEAWYWLGETRRRRGDDEGAIEALDRAARLDLSVFQDETLREFFAGQLRDEARGSEPASGAKDDDSRP
ncbi:MAG: rhomboid family intramembrane serine protease [Planctomycetota bacterium]|nr:rhomboid family intramembrane serine protease [Planctomycetota bacterium]